MEPNHDEVGNVEEIAQFVRDCSPGLTDVPDLPGAIREMALHPLFLPLLMWFSNDIDAQHFKSEQKRKGAVGGKVASGKKEIQRVPARKAYSDNHRTTTKGQTIAKMMLASGLAYNTCKKIYEKEETKPADCK